MARTKKAAKKPSAVDANRRRNTKKHAQQRSVVHWYLDRTAKEIARLKEVEDADAAMAAPDLAGDNIEVRDNIEVQSPSDVSEEDQFEGTLRELQEPLLTISYKLMHCFTPKMMAEAVTLALTYMNDGQECIIAMIINATILLIRIIIVIVVMVIMTLNANQEVLAHPLRYHVLRVQRSAVVKGMWHLSVTRLKKSESDSESD